MTRTQKLLLCAAGVLIVGAAGFAWVRHGSMVPVPQTASVVNGSEIFISSNRYPKVLTIAKLGLTANVEAVGVDKRHNMAVPSLWSDVGWYKYGAVPGQVGNVVIDGHVNNARGTDGVFANLKSLTVGDTAQLTDASNHIYTYRVTDLATVPVSAFPSREVFGTSTVPMLRLITCDGAWIQSQKMYDKRLIVTLELVRK